MENFVIELPEDVKKIINTLEENGENAYAVGGCVRDTILGKEPDDWDITTSAVPNKVKSCFNKTIDTGIKHGTVTVMMNRVGYEVTTYRVDGEYKDGRHPESVEFSVVLTDDLKRRDFTINAMAYNEKEGLVDVFNGVKDLHDKNIRCVGNPYERFNEDALRMMRAIRFSAQLGFGIDTRTYNAIIDLAPNIKKISMERIQMELLKTIMSDNPDYVKYFHETKIFKEVFPKLDALLSGKYARNSYGMLKNSPKTQVMRYAALLNMMDYEDAFETLKALKLDNYTVDTVTKIVKYQKDTIDETEPAVREAVFKYGKELMPLLIEHSRTAVETAEQFTGIKMASKRKHIDTIENMYKDIISRGDCISIKDLDITGNDLMEYGLKGPEIGKVLNQLVHVVIENPKLNDKATLIALIEHLD